jgi:uncharacterized protein (TIGR02453 family)
MTAGGEQFPGFPPQTMTFLADLKANNDRAWFMAHRDIYEAAIRHPAEALVAVLTPALEAISGQAVAGKMFRIHRDVRFSKDKSPYNAHLHIGFALGAGPNRQQSACGFYFGLEPDRLHLGAGAFEFPGLALDRYRAAVADDVDGALAALIQGLEAEGFTLREPDLKRVPAPYRSDHPRGDLLRRKGLTAWREVTDRRLIESVALTDEVVAVFSRLAALNRWISEAIV